MRGSVPDAREGLARAGYLADDATATAVFLADRLGMPLLVEGPAGVGKTQLAVEVARGTRFPDGAWLARLEAGRTAGSIWRSVGEAFGVSEAS